MNSDSVYRYVRSLAGRSSHLAQAHGDEESGEGGRISRFAARTRERQSGKYKSVLTSLIVIEQHRTKN